MYLQLAEGYQPPSQYYMPPHSYMGEKEENPYVFVPDTTGETRGTMVREDYFDFLDEEEWITFMEQLSAYQDMGMSEFAFLSAKGRRRRRRAERQKLRAEKKRAKNEIRLARAQAKREGRGGDVLDSVIGGITSIFGRGEEPPPPDPRTYPPRVRPAIGVPVPEFPEPTLMPPKKAQIFGIDRNIVYTIAGAALLGYIVLAPRKRKRKR